MTQTLSWVCPALGLIAFYAVMRHRWGWLLGVIQQVAYFLYGWLMHQWGWIAFAVAYTVIFTRNYLHQGRSRDA